MANAIGGWRGLIDSSVPGAVFLVVYVADGNQLTPAVWAAVGAGALIAVLRLARRQSLQQVASGFVGIAFCAWLASRTGRAEDFYLPGILINIAYAVGLSVSCVVGHPLLGYGVGAATGDLTGWRAVPEQRRAYSLATWIFAAVFAVRVVVQVPLYLAGWVGPLGIAKLATRLAAVRAGGVPVLPGHREGAARSAGARAERRRRGLTRPRPATVGRPGYLPSRSSRVCSWSGDGDEQQLVAGLQRVVRARARSRGPSRMIATSAVSAGHGTSPTRVPTTSASRRAGSARRGWRRPAGT